MKIIVGIVMGFFSGLLISRAVAMLLLAMFFLNPSSGTSPDDSLTWLFYAVTFFGGWVLSTIILVRGARSVSKVFSRGFLLGAAEWLALIPVG